MKTTKWFDRKFHFSFGMERYTSLYESLENGPALYYANVVLLPDEVLQLKPENKWSIKEHVGHVFLLEPLWRKRFREIKQNRPGMSPADLNNTATDAAGFNNMPLDDILKNFIDERNKTMAFLDSLQQDDFSHSIIHPRLQKPMRIIDLMFFVAEHDRHHLQAIRNLKTTIHAYNDDHTDA